MRGDAAAELKRSKKKKKVSLPEFSLLLLLSSVSPLFSLYTSSHTSSLLSPRSSPSSLSTLFYFSRSLFSSPPRLHSASSSFVSSPPFSLLHGLLSASTLLFTLLPSSFSSGLNFYPAPLISSSSFSSLLLHSLHRSFSSPPSRPPSFSFCSAASNLLVLCFPQLMTPPLIILPLLTGCAPPRSPSCTSSLASPPFSPFLLSPIYFSFFLVSSPLLLHHFLLLPFLPSFYPPSSSCFSSLLSSILDC